METAKLFFVLTESIYHSLIQGLLIYMLAKFIIFLLPWTGSAFRYNLLYLSLSVMFVLFISRMAILVTVTASTPPLVSPVMTGDPVISRPFSLKGLIERNSLLIGFIYLAGILLQAVFLVISLIRLRIYRKRQQTEINTLWQMRVQALGRQLGIRRSVALYFKEAIGSPFTMGWLKPVIFFPVAALNHLSTEQVEAILVHELAHIKRNDYLMNLFQKVMEIILFFNPVTWVLSAEIRREREFCCDDLVVKEGGRTVSYARALFLLENSCPYPSVLLAASGTKKNTLLHRIKRLTDMETSASAGIPRAVALTGVAALILFLGWSKPTEALVAKQKKIVRDTAGWITPPPLAIAEPVVVCDQVPVAPPVAPAPPAPARAKDTAIIDTAGQTGAGRYFNSPEWKLQMESVSKIGENIKKYFESADWKQQMAAIKEQGEQIRKQFDGPEWKAKVKAIQADAEKIQQKFNSPEWKAQQEQIARQAEELAKKFESDEWKESIKSIEMQAKEVERYFNSPEWKKQEEQFRDQAKEMEAHAREMERQSKEMKEQLRKDQKQIERDQRQMQQEQKRIQREQRKAQRS